MLHRKFLVLSLLLLALIPGWASNAVADDEEGNDNVKDTPSDSQTQVANESHTPTELNKPIMVRSASPAFSIRLVANPTTGYQWYLVDYNPRFVKVLGQQNLPAQPKMIGSPGLSVWQFQLQQVTFVAPQVTRITFEYRRPWEQKAVKHQSFTVASEPSSKTG